jgi:IS605 OrfB family transposase
MKTLRIRIKDKHAKALDALSRDVNMVWNYCNDLSYKHLQRTGKIFSSYDLQKYTAGATKEGLSINSASVQMIGAELVTRRKQFQKAKLRWRTSFGSRKSLGWIPFRHDCIAYKNGQLRYAGQCFGLWDSYGLSQYKLGSGSFSQDARGRWYANICVEVPTFVGPIKPPKQSECIGIDLGLKDFASMSDGVKIEAQRLYRGAEAKLAVAQRANKKSRVKAIHAQIANRRKDALHKLSTNLVKQNRAIFVGNVNAATLAKTNMAKSVLDAGWTSFRTMLSYKSIATGVLFEEVNEAFSTQTCSCCGTLPDSRPRGITGLGIREWTCSECGAHHDRDVNAAKNILQRGHALLAVGIPFLSV